MSINNLLLEQKLRHQERAANAEERSHANIVKRMGLPNEIMQENDPKVLKSLIVKQIQKMDDMLKEYEGVQKVLSAQSEQMNKLERQESAGKDATVIQLQKEQDDVYKEYRNVLIKQRNDLHEVERYRNEKLDSKVKVALDVLDEYKQDYNNLTVNQRELVNTYDARTLFEIYKAKFELDPTKLEVMLELQELDVQKTQQQFQDLLNDVHGIDQDMVMKIQELYKDKNILQSKLKNVQSDIDFINRFVQIVVFEKERQEKAKNKEEAPKQEVKKAVAVEEQAPEPPKQVKKTEATPKSSKKK